MPPMTGVLMAIGADMCSIVYSVDRIAARTYHQRIIILRYALLPSSHLLYTFVATIEQSRQ